MTYEEHEKLSEWLRNFSENAPVCFDILKKQYGNKHPLVKNAAKAINSMGYLKIPLQDNAELDRIHSNVSIMQEDEFKKWQKLYTQIAVFTTDGYY